MLEYQHGDETETGMMGRMRRLWTTALVLALFIVMPIPRYWALVQTDMAGLHPELVGINLYASDVAVLLILLGTIPWSRILQTSATDAKHLLLPLFMLVALAGLSATWALDLPLAVQALIRLVSLLATMLIIMRLQPERGYIVTGVALAVGFQAIAAGLQFWLQDDLGLEILGESDLAPIPGRSSVLATVDQVWLRAYGLTPHPNILGGVLATLLMVLIAPALRARKTHQVILGAVWFIGLAGLIVSFSRAAWVGSLTGACFFLAAVWSHKKWRTIYLRSLVVLLLGGSVLLVALASSNLPLMRVRFSPSSNELEARSMSERQVLNNAGRRLFQLSPLTGVGAANFTPAVFALVGDSAGVTPQPAHNMVLLLSAELGLGGGLLWVWLMIAPVVVAVRRLRQGRLSLFALGLSSALVVYGVIDMFDFHAWGWAQGRALRWLLWALWATSIVEGEKEE